MQIIEDTQEMPKTFLFGLLYIIMIYVLMLLCGLSVAQDRDSMHMRGLFTPFGQLHSPTHPHSLRPMLPSPSPPQPQLHLHRQHHQQVLYHIN